MKVCITYNQLKNIKSKHKNLFCDILKISNYPYKNLLQILISKQNINVYSQLFTIDNTLLLYSKVTSGSVSIPCDMIRS